MGSGLSAAVMVLSSRWIVVGLALVLAVGGCASDGGVERARQDVLTLAEVGIDDGPMAATGFRVLRDQPSHGRFPGALAVACLSRADAAADGPEPGSLALASLEEAEAVYWTQLFSAVPAVREVFIMKPRSMSGPDVSAATVARAARRLDAAICLVYGPVAGEADSVALAGTLYDIATGEKLACLSAAANSADFQAPRDDRPDGDRRHQDVDYLVARKFERQVRDCLLQLIALDSPPSAPRSSPWQAADTQPAERPIWIAPTQY